MTIRGLTFGILHGVPHPLGSECASSTSNYTTQTYDDIIVMMEYKNRTEKENRLTAICLARDKALVKERWHVGHDCADIADCNI